MELLRIAVLLSVLLSVMTSLCQGQRSADGRLPSDDVAAGELVSVLQWRTGDRRWEQSNLENFQVGLFSAKIKQNVHA